MPVRKPSRTYHRRMTITHPVGDHAVGHICGDAEWQRGVRWARRLAWVSLAVVLVEGAIGLWEGVVVGSVALTGWALGGASEGGSC